MPLENLWVMAVKVDTASAEERERIARSVEGRVPFHSDWILLSTCHRVELYGFGAMPEVDPRLHVKTGKDTVQHLIRVATGLESWIVGEDGDLGSRAESRARRLARISGGRGVHLGGRAEVASKSSDVGAGRAGEWRELQPCQGDAEPIADSSAPTAIRAAVRTRLNKAFLGI